MTWDKLKEEAKKMGALIVSASSTTPEHIWLGDYLCFYKNGRIEAEDCEEFYFVLATDRTPDQMLAIMKALQ